MHDLKPSQQDLENRKIDLEQPVSKQNNEERKPDTIEISNFSFADLVDISDLQQLLQHLSDISGCAIGILDVNNNFLASAGLQRICTGFHRIHEETNNHCSESDCFIRENLKTKNPIEYRCKNGLWDVAYPIFIEGKHLANIFLGQFFFDDEAIDIPYFEHQAEKYGFDKTEYLKALLEVPIVSHKKVDSLKHFNTALAKILTKTGYSNLLLKREKIEDLKITNHQLAESELKFRTVFEQAGVGVVQIESSTGQFVKINKKFADMLGYSIDEMLQLNFKSITHPDDLEKNLGQMDLLIKKQITEFSIEKRYIRKDGTTLWTILTVTGMSEGTGGKLNNIGIAQDITERKKSEQDLIESELKFRTVFEQAGVGVAQVESATNRFIKINKKFADILGYTVNEMMQLTFHDFTHPDDIEESLHFKDKLNNKKNKEFSTEKRYIRKDRTIVWVKLTTTKMWEIEEGNRYHISIVQDITENKKSAEDLKESEFKFRKLFELAGVGVAQVDISTGMFVKVNKKLAAMLGYNISEMLQLTFKQITHPDDLKGSLQNQKLLIKKQIGDFSIEKRYVRKDGGVVWAILTASSMGEIAGGENFQIAVVQDITENKKAEQILKEENERFHTTMDAIDSVVYVSDLENHEILFVNKYVTNLFGDIRGKKCYSALQGKTAPCDFCTNHKLLDDNGKANPPYIWEFQNLITKNWYQCHDQAIQWMDGKLVRFEIATDISKNIEYEQILEENENKLREINSAKDKFFSIIGHDLKNPFAVLKSSSELLSRYLEKNDLVKSKAKTEMISNATKHGYALLENLLAWAKSQSGGMKFEPEILNFKNKVAKSISEAEGQASLKNIIIINKIPDDLLIEADENLLSVVFRNLLSNAIKFSHHGGKITVTAKSENNLVEVAVIDTGIGIPKEHQYKLFRLDIDFSRVGTANEESTSLGLILCKEFIEKHKGKIWVISDTDKGSEFRFTLPNIQV